MMKTPEEIKYGLECCANGKCAWVSGECPYFSNTMCANDMKQDARAYINELEERISLMMIQMRGDCGVCKHRDEEYGPCDTCMHDYERHGWEYEGLPGDE